MPDCLVPGCTASAENSLGVRLRKPDSTAIWAPQTYAYICDTHARSGARVSLAYEATRTGCVELRVQGASEAIERDAVITH